MSQNIDWHFWKAMRTVKLWQSCALVAGSMTQQYFKFAPAPQNILKSILLHTVVKETLALNSSHGADNLRPSRTNKPADSKTTTSL